MREVNLMQILWIVTGLIISYLIGSVPFGFVIPRLFKGIDIREHGSKNVGATNVMRVLGPKYGIPTFLLDCFKGALPIIIIRYVLGIEQLNLINGYDVVIIYGAAAVLGHVFPLYIGFKGGKAVATGVGAVIALNPIVGLSGIAICIALAYITKYVSIGSVVATFLVGVGMYVWAIFVDNNFSEQIINIIIVSVLVVFIIFKHRKNFVRLAKGTENKIGQRKKQQQSQEENK